MSSQYHLFFFLFIVFQFKAVLLHTVDAHSRYADVVTSLSSEGPRWQSGNTPASHLCGRGSIPVMAVSGKAGSCLPLVGSLQYRTLANYMYWFPLPFQLPVVIGPVQC